MRFIGLDFGAKMAGTTAITFLKNDSISSIQTIKNQDADVFLKEQISFLKPNQIFIDAPLSLPGVYAQPNVYPDFFYRACDKELAAMSPMFLGGLTARAMQLQSKFPAIEFHETYPAHKVKLLGIKELGYKTDVANIPVIISHLKERYSVTINHNTYNSWHAVDSLLAYLSGLDHQHKKAIIIGDKNEGQIIV